MKTFLIFLNNIYNLVTFNLSCLFSSPFNVQVPSVNVSANAINHYYYSSNIKCKGNIKRLYSSKSNNGISYDCIVSYERVAINTSDYLFDNDCPIKLVIPLNV